MNHSVNDISDNQKQAELLKNSLSAQIFEQFNSNLLLCQVCGEEIASIINSTDNDDENNPMYICQQCKLAYIKDEEVKKRISTNTTRYFDYSNLFRLKMEILNQLKANFKLKYPNLKIDLPKSIDDIVLEHQSKENKGRQLIAMIKLDGNNVGVAKSNLSSWAAYRTFSQMLDQKVYKNIKEIIINIVEKDIITLINEKNNKKNLEEIKSDKEKSSISFLLNQSLLVEMISL